MIIGLIRWYIRPGMEEDFLRYWREDLELPDRQCLFGEFLSAVTPGDEIPHPFKVLNPKPGEYSLYINVGLWKDMASFSDQVGQYINDSRKLHSFEVKITERSFLSPQMARLGEWFPRGRVTFI